MTGQRFFQYRAVSIWNSLDKDLKNHGVWDIQVLDSYLLIFLSYYDAKESRQKKKWPREILGQASRPKDLARSFITELKQPRRRRRGRRQVKNEFIFYQRNSQSSRSVQFTNGSKNVLELNVQWRRVIPNGNTKY